MADGSLARRYARALVDLGQEGACVDQLDRDMATFSAVLHQDGDALANALTNPGLTQDERRLVLDRVLGRVFVHPHVRNLLRLLNDKSRFFAFDDIRRAYTELADDLAMRTRATVTTARPLNESMKATVSAALSKSTGRQVIVTFEVDNSLLGGMVAQVGDKVFDASIRARLAELQQSLLHGAAEA